MNVPRLSIIWCIEILSHLMIEQALVGWETSSIASDIVGQPNRKQMHTEDIMIQMNRDEGGNDRTRPEITIDKVIAVCSVLNLGS